MLSIFRVGQITAVINDYADLIFENVQKCLIRNGLDPVEMPDQSLKLFPTGTINLTKGWLEDASTIERYKDVVITYKSSLKKLSCVVPVKFHSLMFTYKYHTEVFFLNSAGDTQGKVTNVRANIKFSFDFEKYEASLDSLDITDTGNISLTFSRNGLIDWITNFITTSVSLVLHPIIIRIIQFVVKGKVNNVMVLVNEAIKHVLSNQTTTIHTYL
ncbi:hypothetical protein NQ315_014167 [Exocentrus adspersus]|uniref:Uncharacterized protein n=1 Tax=Exocentrus adspersus TaxID=1586481 RepID=A0AAV8VW62_9CUCU|nr:hypothetical protein NQ315_014167 [Exocentrus adspersus]